MEQTALTAVLRGAFMELGGGPVFLVSREGENSSLPALEIPSDSGLSDMEPRDMEREAGRILRTALEAAGDGEGRLPAAVRVPGYGSFFAASTYDGACKLRDAGSAAAFEPSAPAGRADTVRGRIALVTGGAQGFGAEIARGLADEGAFVVVADINGDGARAFADELNRDGAVRAMAVAVDVSDEDSVQAMADGVVSSLGGLDLLVSNAGVLRAGSVLELSRANFDFVTKINYSAFFLVVKHCAPVFVRQRAGGPSCSGDIVQINSKSGLEGSNKNGAYAGGKFGGIGLVQSFAMELVEYGVKVNAVCPGNFFDGPLWSHPETGLFVQYLNTGKVPGAETVADVKAFYEAKVPMGRGCSGPDVLKAILYCVDQAYETGQAVPVTGGQVMLK